MVATHSYAWSQGRIGGTELLSESERDALPPVCHPVVNTQSDVAEGRALLRRLTDAACQPPRLFRHRWQAGDLAVWDNPCVLHRGHPWPFGERRVMRRATVAGDGDNPWVVDGWTEGVDRC